MEPTTLPTIKLNEGIHAIHLFYRINRTAWDALPPGRSDEVRRHLEALRRDYPGDAHPRLNTYANVGGKADLAVMILAEELGLAADIHRRLEAGFPPGALERVFTYFSVTESSEYMSTDDDHRARLIREEGLEEGSEPLEARMREIRARLAEYRHYRLYPELPDWEVMCFYPMSKRRLGEDNWYRLEFADRKRLMEGHARVGRKFAGRVTQLITGSTGLDDWEWGVTLVAHAPDAIKEIVYEMRFDEVTARFGEFGPFYVNLRLEPAALWGHLKL